MEKIIGDTQLQSSTGVSNNKVLQYSPMETVDKVHQEEDLPFDVSNVFAYSCCDEAESTTSDAKSSLRKLTLASSESFGPRTTLKRLKSVGTNDRYFLRPKAQENIFNYFPTNRTARRLCRGRTRRSGCSVWNP